MYRFHKPKFGENDPSKCALLVVVEFVIPHPTRRPPPFFSTNEDVGDAEFARRQVCTRVSYEASPKRPSGVRGAQSRMRVLFLQMLLDGQSRFQSSPFLWLSPARAASFENQIGRKCGRLVDRM